VQKKSFEPATIFLFLILFTILISFVGNLFNWQATYDKINLITGSKESVLVTIENLLSIQGLQYLISSATKNFATFAPLVSVIVGFIGIGIIEKSGLFHAVFGRLKEAPLRTITFFIILFSVISSLFNEVGYVIIMPLAALIFLLVGRNPIAGIIASFMGITGGSSINLFVSALDFNLSTYTDYAAKIIDSSYSVSANSNWYLIILATILIATAATVITETWVIPRLGEYKMLEELEVNNEVLVNRGLKYSLMATTLFLILIVYLIVPNIPGSGLLLDKSEKLYLNQLFGYNSYFNQGITFIASSFLVIAGLFYGIGAKTIKNDKDFFAAANNSMKDISRILVLMFFVAQFLSIFKKSNIGMLINIQLVNLIGELKFTGIALVFLIFIFAAIGNLFITSTTIKWSIFAPVVIPLAMISNITPEYTQAIFRAGDSVTKGLTPLLAYFVIFIALVQKYNIKALKETSFSKTIKMIIPYNIAFFAVWIIILVSWYFIGLPIGPNVYPNL